MTPEELGQRLRDLREVSSRAVLAEVVCPADRWEEVSRVVVGALGAEARVVRVEAREAVRRELLELNVSRDLALRTLPGLVLLVTPEAVRFLRSSAPDLTAALDLSVELRFPAAAGWPEVVTALRRALAEQHRAIDLTGLVPATTDPFELPLDETYLRSAGVDAEVLAEDRPTLLVGEPGSGKTTTLRWLCRRHAVGEATPLLRRARLVLLASLASWAARDRERTLGLLPFLEALAGSWIGAGEVPLREHLGELVLLLDGLDEVPDVAARRRCVREALELQRAGAQVVLSGRPHLLDEPAIAELAVVKLREPDEDDVARLLEAVLAARGRSPDPQEVGLALARRTVDGGDLAGFRRLPLLLVFVALLAEMGRELPSLRVELYRDLVEMLLASWRRLRSGAAARPLRRADALRVLGPLGWEMTRRGVGGLAEAELLEVIAAAERRREGDEARAMRVAHERLVQLRDDTALVHAGDVWRFVHPTLAEYFAALATLQDEDALAELLAEPYAPRFATVLPFAVALATEIEARDDVAARIVAALLSGARRPGRKDARVPALLSVVLREAPGLAEGARGRLADEMLRIALTLKLAGGARWVAMWALFWAPKDPPVREAFRRWLCPPRSAVRVGNIVESGASFFLLWALGSARLPVAPELIAACLRSPLASDRAEVWASEDVAVLERLDPDAAAWPSRFQRRLPHFEEVAREVYGEAAAMALGAPPVAAEV